MQAEELDTALILEHINDAVIVLDLQFTIHSWNRAAELIYGWPAADVLGKHFSDIVPTVHYLDGSNHADAFATLLAREVWQELVVQRHHDGHELVVDASVRLVRDPLGMPLYMVAINRDITDRWRMEQASVHNEAYFRALIEDASDAVVVLERDVSVRYTSPSMERMLGYTSAERRGQSGFALIHPDDLALAHDIFLQVLSNPGDAATMELRARHKDGSWRILAATARNLLDHPAVRGIVVNAHDITARKAAETALDRERAFLRAVLDNVAEDVVGCDAQGVLTRFSTLTGAFAHLPYDPVPADQWPEHFALYHADGVTPMRKEDIPLYRALQGERVRDVDMVVAHQDGSVHAYLASGSAIYDLQGEKLGAIVVMHDITERRRAEEAVRQAKDEAERANQAKSEFLGRISHELRTPLTTIIGFGRYLLAEPQEPHYLESAGYIVGAGEHLLGLIDDVLDFARIEETRLRVSIQPVPIREVVHAARAMVQPLATSRNIHLDDRQLVGNNGRVMADVQRLRQVLVNLLTNAIKYNYPGGSVLLHCEEGGGRVRIVVSDTGRGIPPEQCARLFMPFERLGAETSGVEGIGLGLALSKQLVEAMNGTIGLESRAGHGSAFWVDLPLAYVDDGSDSRGT